MAKLTVFAALLIALIAGATAYTTVVTTTVTEEENPQQSCQMEVERMQMRPCMQYMRKGTPFLRSAVANPRYGEEEVEECCSQMQYVRPECHCDMVRRMMMEMQREYGQMEEMQPMMMQKFQTLFNKCGMRFPEECRFRA